MELGAAVWQHDRNLLVTALETLLSWPQIDKGPRGLTPIVSPKVPVKISTCTWGFSSAVAESLLTDVSFQFKSERGTCVLKNFIGFHHSSILISIEIEKEGGSWGSCNLLKRHMFPSTFLKHGVQTRPPNFSQLPVLKRNLSIIYLQNQWMFAKVITVAMFGNSFMSVTQPTVEGTGD